MSIQLNHIAVKLARPDKAIQVYYYWKSGTNSKAETILILPGLDESITDYHQFFEYLNSQVPGHSLLAIDLRGQGQTLIEEKKTNSLAVSINIEEQNLIINAIIDKLKIEDIILIGLSYGAGVGLYFTNRNLKVKGLFLLAPYVSKFKMFQPGVTGIWYRLIHLNPFYRALSYFTLPFYFHLAKRRGRLNHFVTWDHKHMRALTKLSTGIMKLSTTKEAEKLRNLDYGVNILIGEQDDLVSIPAIKFLMEKIKTKNKRLDILPKLGHRILINHYQESSTWLTNIIKENKNKYLNLQ